MRWVIISSLFVLMLCGFVFAGSGIKADFAVNSVSEKVPDYVVPQNSGANYFQWGVLAFVVIALAYFISSRKKVSVEKVTTFSKKKKVVSKKKKVVSKKKTSKKKKVRKKK